MKKFLIGLITIVAIIMMVMCGNNRSPQSADHTLGNCRICPKCKSDSTAEIMYGLLTNEERANWDSFQTVLRQQKKVVGGCVVGPERFYCYNCGNKW